MFYDFLRKNQFLPIFYTQNGHFSIFVGALTLSYGEKTKQNKKKTKKKKNNTKQNKTKKTKKHLVKK